MNLNPLRKLLFTNLIAERIFNFFLRHGLLRKLVYKLIPSNLLYPKGTIRIVQRNGTYYRLDISDYQEWLVYFYHDNDSSYHILKYIDGAEVIFDIGGNIGQTALNIAKYKAGKKQPAQIISFEPYNENYEKLRHNIQLNKHIKNISIENIALGSILKTVKLFKECATNSGGNRVVYDEEENTEGVEEVHQITLDSYIDEKKILKVDLIKIDVEGYELEVLKGAKNTLQKFRPVLLLEFDSLNLKKQGSSPEELLNFLKSAGYNYKDINTGLQNIEFSATGNIHTDIICISKKHPAT